MKCKECKGTGQDNKEYTRDLLKADIEKEYALSGKVSSINDFTMNYLINKTVNLTNRVQELENE